MNVVFISSQPYPYGMAGSKRIRLFAEFLGIKHRVKVLITGKSNLNNKLLGVLNNISWEFVFFSRISIVFNVFKVRKLLIENYSKNDTNILYLYNGIGLTNYLFSIVGRRLNFEVYTDIVEDYSVQEESTSLPKTILHKINILFDKYTYHFVDGIITISQTLFNKYLASKDSFRVIHIPISAENIDIGKKDKTLDDKLHFVYSGTYGKKDGIAFLINSFKRLKKTYSNIELILAGTINDETRKAIKNIDSVKYIGRVSDDDYYNFLGVADVLLMTRTNSKYANAGFPFKLGEYLASKTAVIATKVSDIEYYLSDKENAILAEASDIQSLYNAMEYCVLNKNKLNIIGNKGFEISLEYFNPYKNGKKLESFLEGK